MVLVATAASIVSGALAERVRFWPFVIFAVVLTNPEASLIAQLSGIAAVGTFVFLCSFTIWFLLRVMNGIRLQPEQEVVGGDLSELGVRAYNFSWNSVL